ncbi:N-acetylmuramoyl-L-alanine amidase [Crenothrix polyspora]|uniref:N-acetylmuramoyl-L-alanine amidase AmiC n=1 Tax=Crenothrix polyspora TaxID=360316 RepID=A0A1R4GZ28_9GAMM|nr:N-acetylmuramoyl-L-alanine amidase [Crenothrix polyspora]SJM89238.1 N-acetylmuramoyl-L-alanine amidase AmiC [Crenothrix polyspora]
MKIHLKILFFCLLQLTHTVAYAQQININSLRYVTLKNQVRLLFDVSSSPKHRVFVLDNPPRLVIDFKDTHAEKTLGQPAATHPLFVSARTATQSDGVRIVIDLKKPISAKHYTLKSSNADEHRVTVDLVDKNNVSKNVDDTTQTKVETAKKIQHAKRNDNSDEPKAFKRHGKRIVIAIDAGHGGEDPGARGPQGTLEKTVTLALAKKLKAFIDAEPGMRAVLVRKNDIYVGLRKRMALARAVNADLFISIHADAVQDTSVRGASVYTLSMKGASSEAARWLANSENASELVGGVSLDDKEDMLASVLLDLSQTATQEASNTVADKILRNVEGIGHLHKNAVQQAGFMVLKSPDIPSILVETAFISNPSEELNLLSSRYQTKMASAIFKGVVNYFKHATPENSKIAAL